VLFYLHQKYLNGFALVVGDTSTALSTAELQQQQISIEVFMKSPLGDLGAPGAFFITFK